MVFGLPYGRKFSELFKVCGLGDGYKAAKTRETHISEYVYEKNASESTKKASWGDLEVILGRPGTVLRPLGAVLGRSWESPVFIKIDLDAMKKISS